MHSLLYTPHLSSIANVWCLLCFSLAEFHLPAPKDGHILVFLVVFKGVGYVISNGVPVALFGPKIFLFAFCKRDGARLRGVVPWIHDDVQNRAVFLSPMVTTVEAANRSWSHLSQGTSILFHARSLCFHLNHNHRNLSAWAKRSKSKIPSPPLSLGRQVVGQFTNECPPYTLSRVSPL